MISASRIVQKGVITIVGLIIDVLIGQLIYNLYKAHKSHDDYINHSETIRQKNSKIAKNRSIY